MTEWFQKSIDALNLNGKAERTQEAYTRALRMLCEFYGNKPPEAITEAELEAYFLRRKNVDRWSSNTMRICPRRPPKFLHLWPPKLLHPEQM